MSLSPDHIPPNEPDAFGTFPIQFAMNNRDPEMVKLVIDTGADPNIDLGQGCTPLHEAIDCAIDGMIQNRREAPYPGALEKYRFTEIGRLVPEIQENFLNCSNYRRYYGHNE